MANDNVVALHGAILPDVAGVDEGLVAELERLLEALLDRAETSAA